MPCSSTHLYRQAAHQTQQHLWITDDILIEAFHRFARVSLANRRHSEGRRYGSNVPGPLEARRRLAKRRMGVVAASAANASSSQDFGALFGLGFGASRGQLPADQDWKWQPPGIQDARSRDTQGKRNSKGWPFDWSNPHQQNETWKQFLHVPEVPAPIPEQNLVQESQQTFDTLMNGLESLDLICKEKLGDVVHFLQTSSDEPKAHNTSRLFDRLASRRISSNAITVLASLVQQKILLGTLDVEEASLILMPLLNSTEVQHTELLEACLHALHAEGYIGEVCVTLTKKLVQSSNRHHEVVQAEVKLLHWLECLRKCKHLQGPHHLHRTWQGVYSALASARVRPSTIAPHLVKLGQLDLSHVLLHHWVPNVLTDAEAGKSLSNFQITHSRLEKRLTASRTVDLERLLMETLSSEFQNVQTQAHRNAKGRSRPPSPLIAFLSVLQSNHIPCSQMLHDIFDIIMLSTPQATFDLINEICKHQTLGVDSVLATSLIQYFIATKNLDLALKFFDAMPTLSVQRCHGLLLELIDNSTVASARIFRMLLRKTAEDILPPESRPSFTPELSLRPEQIDLVHDVAYAFAQAPRITPRVAFRRVWECYRLLSAHRAPISAVITRAFVHAGVIRPLQDWTRVNSSQFKYICRLVSAVEGNDVAHALDRLVYQQWNQGIAPKLQARQVREEVEDWVRVELSDVKSAGRRKKNWHLRSRWVGGKSKRKNP